MCVLLILIAVISSHNDKMKAAFNLRSLKNVCWTEEDKFTNSIKVTEEIDKNHACQA